VVLELVSDAAVWPERVARLAACALDRVRHPEWSAQVARAERWADGGGRARNSGGSRLACMNPVAGSALLHACVSFPFRQGWAALADVMGPLELPQLPAGWHAFDGGVIPAMAAQIYQDRDWGLCPVLADALWDAGCDDTDLLGHLRWSLPHYAGCWAVDLLTGRMDAPRRRRLRRLPRVDRPTRWDLLLEADGAEGNLLLDRVRPPQDELMAALFDPEGGGPGCPVTEALMDHLSGLPLPVLATRDEPWQGCGTCALRVWRGDLVLTVSPPRVVLEREVLA